MKSKTEEHYEEVIRNEKEKIAGILQKFQSKFRPAIVESLVEKQVQESLSFLEVPEKRNETDVYSELAEFALLGFYLGSRGASLKKSF